MNLKIKSINNDQELPVEQVHEIDQDIHNRLWMATSAGLVCYNGASIKTYDSRNGIECVGLRTVSIVSTNEVWIGTDRGLEVLDLQGNKIPFQLDFEWIYGVAESIISLNEYIYVGTSNGLLKLKKKNNVLQLAKVLKLGFVSNIILCDDSSILVISGSEGLIRIKGDSWVTFSKDISESATVLCIKKTIDNYILAGTTEGLYILTREGEITSKLILNKLDRKVSKITISGSDWWLGFGNKLALTNHTSEGIKVTKTIELDSIINDIYVDTLNNVWVATNNSGLKKITCLRSAIEHVAYGKNSAVYSIKKEKDDDGFFISGDGMSSRIIYKPFNLETTFVNPFFDLPVIIWDSCVDPTNDKKIWLATQDGLYISNNGEAPYKFKSKKNNLNMPCRVLQVVENKMWLGTIGGLFIIEEDSFTEVVNHKNEPFGYIYTLTSAANNDLWIGTLGQGLWLKTETSINHIITDVLTPTGNTYAIDLNANNEVAILQDEKLILIDNEQKSHLIFEEYPIAGWSITWTSQNQVAIGSTNGIILVNINTKTVAQRINLHLDKTDWQFTFSKSIYLYKRQYLFCGLNAGLYVVDLKQIEKLTKPPEVQLDIVSWQNVTPNKQANVFTVATGKWSVNASVYTAWFVDSSQVQYRFKMVGFDTEWSSLSYKFTTKYNSLPPGEYELQTQVFTPLTGFGEITSLMNLVVVSPWWVTGVVPFMDATRAFYYKFFKSPVTNKNLIEKNIDLKQEIENRKVVEQELKNNQHQLEDVLENYKQSEENLSQSNDNLRQLSSRLQKILEDEKTAIAREVHDVLGQRLTQLKLDASWLDGKLKGDSYDYQEKTEGMIDVIDGTISIVRKIASNLRPSILDDFGIQAAIEWHASAFEKLTDIPCVFEENELSENYSDDVKTAIFRIFQESLTNIIRHAQATEVIVRLYENEENIILEIEDNGIGISELRKNNTTSLGLLGMKERVAILMGTFFITNLHKEGGTLVKIEIPFKNENIIS